MAAELARRVPKVQDVAGYNIRRETEYGLAFYRDRPVPIYEHGEIPSGEHVLISRSPEAPQEFLKDRTALRIGEFAPQKLYFYWVGGK